MGCFEQSCNKSQLPITVQLIYAISRLTALQRQVSQEGIGIAISRYPFWHNVSIILEIANQAKLLQKLLPS